MTPFEQHPLDAVDGGPRSLMEWNSELWMDGVDPRRPLRIDVSFDLREPTPNGLPVGAESTYLRDLYPRLASFIRRKTSAKYAMRLSRDGRQEHVFYAPAKSGLLARKDPLTALGMVDTMRLEGYSGLIHTAAASNLGQMLQKICIDDDVPLVNIVRKPEQAQLLRDIGAQHVCDSSSDTFEKDLTAAIAETGAYLAFDATGGGELASQILACMEAAAVATAEEYSRYGSTQHKQVYIYGGLDRTPTILKRSYGMSWSVGGWLLTPFLQKVGRERAGELRQRVADEVRTTFYSSYAAEISLAGALQLENLQVYAKQATGEKYLINPQG